MGGSKPKLGPLAVQPAPLAPLVLSDYLHGQSEARFRVLAERLRLALAETVLEVGDTTLSVTGSFGVAECQHDLDGVDNLIDRADRALYVAKHLGRDRVVRFALGETVVKEGCP